MTGGRGHTRDRHGMRARLPARPAMAAGSMTAGLACRPWPLAGASPGHRGRCRGRRAGPALGGAPAAGPLVAWGFTPTASSATAP